MADVEEKDPETLLTKQIARKLLEKHSERVNGHAVGWQSAPIEERKLWWELAKSAVYLVKSNGYTKPPS